LEGGDDDHLGWGVLSWQSFGTLLVIISLDNVVQARVLVFVAFLMIEKGLPLAIGTMATMFLLIHWHGDAVRGGIHPIKSERSKHLVLVGQSDSDQALFQKTWSGVPSCWVP
jgi:hypothetical protein